tara:strand:- start:172 stop:468 length:297 start_codon:yes stop_codon:yes gene_type:complete
MDFFKNGSGWCRRHNPRAKPKAASSKPHAPIFRKQKAASLKQAIQETVPQCDIEEAAGLKPQASKAPSCKPQAPSNKLQAPKVLRRISEAPSRKRQAP